MSEPDKSTSPQTEPKPAPVRRPLWKSIVKWVLITVVSLLLLVGILLTVAVNYLKPDRLTPIVEKTASEYLDADVSIDRVELSFWSTFPRFEVDVRNLSVVSRALRRLPAGTRSQLPQWSDSLASVRGFNAAINVPELMIGRIALYDIIFDSPRVNLVNATAETANYDVVPGSGSEPEDKQQEALTIPDFSFGTFEIRGGMPIRYYSLPDSTDITVNLSTTSLKGKDAPSYKLEVSGLSSATVAGIVINGLRFGLGGEIKWNHREPWLLTLDRVKTGLAEVTAVTSATVNFADTLTVSAFDFELPLTRFNDILAIIPAGMQGELAKIQTDMALKADISLTRPYRPAIDSIPSFALSLNVPPSQAKYDNLILKKLELDAAATVDGTNPDNSVVNLKKLVMIGEGVGFELNADITTPVSDPAAKGTFKGGISMARLPKLLTSRLPFSLKGELRTDCGFAFRQSYFAPDKFHRISLKGDATLKNFYFAMNDASAKFFTDKAELRLGTDTEINNGKIQADSLLTASLTVDSISFFSPGMEIEGSRWKVGVGAQNKASSSDTTVINPIGGRISGKLLTMRSDEDSTRIRLRDVTIGASLRRYNGNSRQPLLHADIYAGRAFYGDRLNRASLKKAFMAFTAHPAPLKIGKRMRARMDSIAARHPGMSPDSVYAEARRIGRKARMRRQSNESVNHNSADVDFELDNSTRRLLRRWNAEGVVKAEKARVFTPYFPVKNVLSDLNLEFNTDEVTISDTRYRMGNSDFLINGSISNITKALTSRRGEALDIAFDLDCDTIDINQISAAAFAGAAFANSANRNSVTIPDSENEIALQKAVENAAQPEAATAIVVPSNIDALLNVRARNVIYSDLLLHDLTGSLMVLDGAINLHALRARTDIGSVDLSALYSAPAIDSLKFAFGVKINDFHIEKFMKFVPAVDSLMPLLRDISGIINADIAAASSVDSMMNIDIPSLTAAIKISGDSLVLLDAETFRTVSKWLLFKNKQRNMIDHMSVEMVVKDSYLEMFPFMFDIDRYKLGVMGTNDLAMNFNYHVAVLKSPLPFRFGINLKGNADNFKVRLGRAKLNEKSAGVQMAIADTTRINLVNRIENIFRRAAKADNSATSLRIPADPAAVSRAGDSELNDTISHADSLLFIKEGVLPAPPQPAVQLRQPDNKEKNKKKKK